MTTADNPAPQTPAERRREMTYAVLDAAMQQLTDDGLSPTEIGDWMIGYGTEAIRVQGGSGLAVGRLYRHAAAVGRANGRKT